MAVKDLGKAILTKLFKDYRLNVIYASDGPPNIARSMPAHPGFTSIEAGHLAAMERSQTAKIRGSAGYGRAKLKGFAIVDQGIPVCAAHFAAPAQYNRAGTWPLKQGQLALMDIATEESVRGRGLAGQLIAQSTEYFRAHGAEAVIAFIWWSNTPSLRAFTKAGWRKIGFSVELLIGGKWRSLHIKLP
jgi:ribosomal protein S18 acetylase RimI-like enzyme